MIFWVKSTLLDHANHALKKGINPSADPFSILAGATGLEPDLPELPSARSNEVFDVITVFLTL